MCDGSLAGERRATACQRTSKYGIIVRSVWQRGECSSLFGGAEKGGHALSAGVPSKLSITSKGVVDISVAVVGVSVEIISGEPRVCALIRCRTA